MTLGWPGHNDMEPWPIAKVLMVLYVAQAALGFAIGLLFPIVLWLGG